MSSISRPILAVGLTAAAGVGTAAFVYEAATHSKTVAKAAYGTAAGVGVVITTLGGLASHRSLEAYRTHAAALKAGAAVAENPPSPTNNKVKTKPGRAQPPNGGNSGPGNTPDNKNIAPGKKPNNEKIAPRQTPNNEKIASGNTSNNAKFTPENTPNASNIISGNTSDNANVTPSNRPDAEKTSANANVNGVKPHQPTDERKTSQAGQAAVPAARAEGRNNAYELAKQAELAAKARATLETNAHPKPTDDDSESGSGGWENVERESETDSEPEIYQRDGPEPRFYNFDHAVPGGINIGHDTAHGTDTADHGGDYHGGESNLDDVD